MTTACGSVESGKSVDRNNPHPLVPVPPGSLTETTGGSHGVLARMSSDVLAIVRAKDRELEQARFRIGEYEFREPDYRQILRWAEALNLSPEQVLASLEASKFQPGYGEIHVELGVVDGALSSLVWDLTKLPLGEFGWDGEVRAHTMAFLSDEPLQRLPRDLPPSLRTLVFAGLRLEGLDLSAVPQLTKLRCDANQLTKLDLSAVPQLTEFSCSGNELTELDLSVVPQLTKINCDGNDLTELDLSALSQLTELSCSGLDSCFGNQLTELDLSAVPQLTTLNCDGNHLAELNLSAVPHLSTLRCGVNSLNKLDLSAVPQLTELSCDNNQLPELSLSALSQLTFLSCSGNEMTDLVLSAVPLLTTLRCYNNPLTELDIRPLQNLQFLSVGRHVRIIGTPPEGCMIEPL